MSATMAPQNFMKASQTTDPIFFKPATKLTIGSTVTTTETMFVVLGMGTPSKYGLSNSSILALILNSPFFSGMMVNRTDEPLGVIRMTWDSSGSILKSGAYGVIRAKFPSLAGKLISLRTISASSSGTKSSIPIHTRRSPFWCSSNSLVTSRTAE